MAQQIDRGAVQHLDSNNNRSDRGAVEISATSTTTPLPSHNIFRTSIIKGINRPLVSANLFS